MINKWYSTGVSTSNGNSETYRISNRNRNRLHTEQTTGGTIRIQCVHYRSDIYICLGMWQHI